MTEVIIPVILCGGSGTRLWPASREHRPKQFLPLIDDHSLLQNTAMRALRISGANGGNLVTVTHAGLASQVKSQLAAISPEAAQHILSEPSSRNTAAAVAYAASYIERTFGRNAVMWVLPSDHYIGDEGEMDNALLHALPAAREGLLVTFGIRPTRPETGYGYIRLGAAVKGQAVYRAQAFVEKPDRATAATYLDAGNYLWNSGMFLFSTSVLLDEYRNHAAGILKTVALAMDSAAHATAAHATHYASIAEVPFDKAIMEKSVNVAVVPCDPSWSDIGSWESLWEIGDKDHNGNVIAGNAVCENTRDCLIHAQDRLVTCAGLENMVIVDTGDAILVAARSDGDAMRSLVKTLKKDGYAEVSRNTNATTSLSAAA
jgi:mannose-1-phosphate guanylyltransferase/mannose-6-phosphate isomerase